MVSGQSYTEGKCLDCGSVLPPLVDTNGWGLAKCTACGRYHDTAEYERAGGMFHKGNCQCKKCDDKERATRKVKC